MMAIWMGLGCIVAAFAVVGIAAKVDSLTGRPGPRDTKDWVISLAAWLFLLSGPLIFIGAVAEILNRLVAS